MKFIVTIDAVPLHTLRCDMAHGAPHRAGSVSLMPLSALYFAKSSGDWRAASQRSGPDECFSGALLRHGDEVVLSECSQGKGRSSRDGFTRLHSFKEASQMRKWVAKPIVTLLAVLALSSVSRGSNSGASRSRAAGFCRRGNPRDAQSSRPRSQTRLERRMDRAV